MNSFELSNKAKQDLKNIARYTEQKWGRQKRNQYIKSLDGAFYQLAENPALAMIVDDIQNGYYKFPKMSHVIYFIQVSKTKIRIIRILHHRMDVKMKLY
jgi:toxin ParE1/3/4